MDLGRVILIKAIALGIIFKEAYVYIFGEAAWRATSGMLLKHGTAQQGVMGGMTKNLYQENFAKLVSEVRL